MDEGEERPLQDELQQRRVQLKTLQEKCELQNVNAP
jgi:hypothetical protein